MAQASGAPIEILLVEDNPGDVRLTQEAVREAEIRNTLNVVNDGEQAIAYVRRQGDYADRPRPDLILLDLNLPRKDGREVLQDLKSDPRPAPDPGGGVDQFGGRAGHPAHLRPVRQRLRDETRGPGAVHARGGVNPGLLAEHREAAAGVTRRGWGLSAG